MIHVVSVRRDKQRHSNGYGCVREGGGRRWVDEGKMRAMVRVGREGGRVELVDKEIGCGDREMERK